MPDVYRVRCKIGKAEVEVESSNKRYVEDKLVGLLEQLGVKGDLSLVKAVASKSKKKAAQKKAAKKKSKKKAAQKKAAQKKAPAKKVAKKKAPAKKVAKKKAPAKKVAKKKTGDKALSVAALAQAIRKQPGFAQAAHNVLNGGGQLQRVMMCHYYAAKLGAKQGLTATEVEKITDRLGARIASPNVAKVIREKAQKYFSSDRQGGVTRQRINRAGLTVAARMIRGQA